MDSKNTTGRIQGMVWIGLFLLAWMVFAVPAGAQDYLNPQARLGWKVVPGDELQLAALPREAAPALPRWRAHDTESRVPDGSSPSRSVLEERMKGALSRAIEVVNRYLPNDFDRDFELWIFREVPYAAKTLNPQVILSDGLIQSDDWERLPFVLAHEIHHLALMKSGWLHAGVSARNALLAGLLTEGTATWLSVESRLFPEMDQILEDREQLAISFDQVRQALDKTDRDLSNSGQDLYQQSKWGYYAGCRVIQQIEERFGRKAWLQLLSMPLEEASQEMIRLYLLTEPPPEYRF